MKCTSVWSRAWDLSGRTRRKENRHPMTQTRPPGNLALNPRARPACNATQRKTYSNLFGQVRTALDPRMLQFALKYVF